MPELRHNIISRQWVIIASERARRPDKFASAEKPRAQLPRRVPDCPFCPGNEAQTPAEVYRLPEDGGWQVRVIPNKYPALAAQGELVRMNVGIKHTMSGVGLHEVVIESPDHNHTPALMSAAELTGVLHTHLQRYHAVLSDPRVEQVTLFKNHGPAAGTSLEHPHSQLIGTPIISPEVRERMETALKFYDDMGQCIFCATLRDEIEDGTRLVEENEHFVAFIPFAALSPFHLWIYPRRHGASFGRIEPAEIPSLAEILRRVLRKLYDGLGDPDYNLVVRTAPKESEQVRYYHWYLTLVPRVTKAAGFELGSGMYINTAQPEQSAEFLRGLPVD